MPDDAVAVTGTVEACSYAAADGKMPQPPPPPPPLLYHSPPNNRFGDTNKTNLNGSIITLTMKNNHLIVETEERVPVIIILSINNNCNLLDFYYACAENHRKYLAVLYILL